MTGNVLAARYELLEQLAEGLLFQVYRARDLTRARVVTLKAVRAPYTNNQPLLDALQMVLDSRQRLRSPHLLELYESDLTAQPAFFVEEFVRGLDLQTRIRRTAPFTVPIAVEIMIGIVEGLQAIHSAGLTHGDLRPANVLVGSEWHVWLNGIGMRGVYRAEPGLAAAHEARAMAYTAPELFRGAAPSVASDLYACGVMLFEMITAAAPFTGETPVLAAESHLNDPIPSLRQRNPATPRTLEGIATKCLQKDPARRYATALQLLNDLKAVRDALRFGKSLGWSPIDLPDTTSAKPTPSDLFDRKPTPLPSATNDEEEEDEIPKWLRTMIRLTGALVALGLVIGFAAWMAMRFVPEDRPIPQVVGQKLDEANRILRNADLEPEVRLEGYSEQYPPGVVYSVNPPEGRVVRKGSKVYLWVSKGSRFVSVPNVSNMPESRARRELEGMGLAVMDSVEERKHATVPLGHVIGTVPPAGARIDRSRPIKLIVSVGAGYDTPTSTTPEPEPPQPDAPQRTFEVKIDLSGQPDRQIRIEVEDALGKRTVLDELRTGGQVYTIPVEAQGASVKIRVYVDEQLVQEITR
ncbi:MAG: serine/threonine protein kinase [Fimbriimonadales bacterium]|nr:MAG: serine/threonine protein kinase [Fimbriimonadales bacterium]